MRREQAPERFVPEGVVGKWKVEFGIKENSTKIK